MRSEHGSVSILAAASVAVLLAVWLVVAACARVLGARAQAQTAADAAALAAAAGDRPAAEAARLAAANGARLVGCRCPSGPGVRIVEVEVAVQAEVPLVGTLAVPARAGAEYLPAVP